MNAKCCGGLTPIFYVSSSEKCRILLDAGAGVSDSLLLHCCSLGSPVEVVRVLLERGAKKNIEKRDSQGYTPLLRSANDGELGI